MQSYYYIYKYIIIIIIKTFFTSQKKIHKTNIQKYSQSHIIVVGGYLAYPLSCKQPKTCFRFDPRLPLENNS